MSPSDDEILEVWTDNDQPPTLLRQALDTVECRSCHAQPGKPCRTKTGDKIVGVHLWRWQDYEWQLVKAAA